MRYLWWTLVLLSTAAYGQEEETRKTRLLVGYYGETVTHPGLTVGVERALLQTEKYQVILAADAGGYVHVRNNSSLFVRVRSGQRRTFRNGLFLDHFLGLGYLRHFTHGGETYEVLPNGAVVEVNNAGRSMVMPSVALGTGYDFARRRGTGVSVYVRPELFWKAPFNGYYLTHFALHAGVMFNL